MERITLLLAIALGIFFRVWQINAIPPGMAMDEAAFGYNAWSIATNLHDEYGKFMPTSFRSFADFKLPAYGYLTAVVVRFFGPGIWQTRAISVIAGLASCFLLYLIVEQLDNERLAVISAIVMLLSPWGIFYSRGAFEGNLGLMFMLLGVYGLVRSRENARFMILAALMFSLANYSYITYKFVTPVFLVIFLFSHRHKHKFSKEVLAGCLIFIMLSLPAFLMFLNISGTNRIASLLKTSPQETGYPLIVNLTASYLTYFSPKNLFLQPDPTKHRHFTDLSTFYSYLIIFWVIGIYLLVKRPRSELNNWVITLLLVGPIPATLATDPYATLRAIPMLPAYCTLLGIGIVSFLDRFTKFALRIGCMMICLASIQMYAALCVMKNGQTAEWNMGIGELVDRLSAYPERPVFVDISTDVYPNLALELRYPPSQMQAERTNVNLESYYTDPVFPETIVFGRYSVGRTDRSKAIVTNGAILVTTRSKLFDDEPKSGGWNELFRIKDAVGNDLFLGFALN